ncbi:coiled-coil domain-containing protein 182 [Pituophis catenifer annectens]|uniref:coiled-coil domain-containing protein 182 n=1 Tax=Pituophis catenifer annectens TaxID=94852 RepID=UPI003993F7FA
MNTIKNFIFGQKETEAYSREGPVSSSSHSLAGDQKLGRSPAQASHSSSRISPGCNQDALDLEKLHHEMRIMEKDIKVFQQEIMETLNNLEGTLSYLTDLMARLENKTGEVEPSFRDKDNREITQNKVLPPCLLSEKELHKKPSTLEKTFFSKSAQLELIVQKWAKE